jgi:hypothetical protein
MMIQKLVDIGIDFQNYTYTKSKEAMKLELILKDGTSYPEGLKAATISLSVIGPFLTTVKVSSSSKCIMVE